MGIGRLTAAAGCLALGLSAMQPAQAIVVGQVDDFEDGTTAGWLVNLLGMGAHPAPPANVADGGPAGLGDAFLRLASVGGAGAGSRLVALNPAQWTGDFAASGVTRIALDARNLSGVDLTLRLYLENPAGAPPTAEAMTAGALLPAGGDWTHLEFGVTPADLTVLSGDLTTLLAGVTALRILHAPSASFPPPVIVAQLGIDNVAALAVPAPAGLALLGPAIGALAWSQCRSRRS